MTTEAMTASQQAIFYLSGRVQGVYCRASLQVKARQLGISGYAKNLADGRVEVLAQGTQASIKELLAFAEAGPGVARVDKLELHWQDLGQRQDGFAVY